MIGSWLVALRGIGPANVAWAIIAAETYSLMNLWEPFCTSTYSTSTNTVSYQGNQGIPDIPREMSRTVYSTNELVQVCNRLWYTMVRTVGGLIVRGSLTFLPIHRVEELASLWRLVVRESRKGPTMILSISFVRVLLMYQAFIDIGSFV